MRSEESRMSEEWTENIIRESRTSQTQAIRREIPKPTGNTVQQMQQVLITTETVQGTLSAVTVIIRHTLKAVCLKFTCINRLTLKPSFRV